MNTREQFYDVAVIGAGIAGLTAACLLQRDGARVLLLERHDKPGGCAGYFSLGDYTFAAGATVALGLENGGLHQRVFDYLGDAGPRAHQIPGLRVVMPDRELMFARDEETWKRERAKLHNTKLRDGASSHAAGQLHGQELFWRLQALTADAGWRALSRLPSLPLQTSRDFVRTLKLVDPRLLPMLLGTPLTVEQVMRALRVHEDTAFRAFVNLALIITVQEEAERAPWSNGAVGLDLWRHGAWHLEGGMGALAQRLADCLRRDGGDLRFAEEVCRVTAGRGEFEIRSNKSVYRAEKVIANVPVWNVEKLVDLPPRAARNVQKLTQRAGEGWGAVTLYAALRDDAQLQHASLHHQVLLDYKAKPGEGRDVFLSLSRPNDTQQAPCGFRALTASTHVRTSDWNVQSRAYREQKNMWRERLLQGVARALPDFDERRSFVVAGTPKTWEDYTKRENGTVGGVRVTRSTANFAALPSRLGLRNFWLVGDSVFPGQGTVACALSGLNAWRDISGKADFCDTK